VAFALQLLAQLTIVVNLTAESNDIPTISGKHWLMTRSAGVNDCQTAMTQTCAPTRVVNGLRGPNTFVVATTMLDGLQHRTNASFGIETD
jgi:hypothetical protein